VDAFEAHLVINLIITKETFVFCFRLIKRTIINPQMDRLFCLTNRIKALKILLRTIAAIVLINEYNIMRC